jgi:hypothetical protein
MGKEGNQHTYEFFIRKAYNYDDRKDKNGANSDIFNMLMISEEDTSVGQSIRKKKPNLLADIKGYIAKAIDKFQSRKKLLDTEKEALELMQQKLIVAQNSDDLYSLIQLSLPMLERLTA